MSDQPEHVLVIGAGLAGLRTAEALRAAGHQGRISLVGAEPHLPYDRPPLSKQVLTGEWEPSKAVLRAADGLEELGIRAHLGAAAVALDAGRVDLDDGSSLHGDAVVVATGVTPRRLPGQPDQVRVLRTLDDAVALRADLAAGGSMVIVGAGFIGAEVACAARGRGLEVTVLEAANVPLARAFGDAVGGLCARLVVEAGVDLRVGTEVTGFADQNGRIGVDLAGGERVAGDSVVVGIGAVADLDWLAGSGIPVDDGVVCDHRGRVDGIPGVWAVGDVAAWVDPAHGDRRRTEHWTSAVDQAAAVARDILGMPAAAARVPYVWSDQFGLKIQVFGRPDRARETIPLHGDGLAGGEIRGTVAGLVTDDTLVAVVGFSSPRRVARYRALVAASSPVAEALRTAAELG